jgi:hypothetical protein
MDSSQKCLSWMEHKIKSTVLVNIMFMKDEQIGNNSLTNNGFNV